MPRRLRPSAARAALVAACLWAAVTTNAHAFVYTDINNWGLSESTSTYDGGQQFHISFGGNDSAAYRWVDNDLTRTTVISGNTCTDYALLGKTTIGGGDTSYHTLFFGFTGQCFVLRGRTAAGSGSTIPHDGRLRR